MKWWQRLFAITRPQPPESALESAPTADDSPSSDDPIHLEVTDVLDLHQFAPRDVEGIVEEYLQLANDKRFPAVRIIHGKGIGVQREMVRKILARSRFVHSFQDAPENAGGWGATVAWFISSSESRRR